MSEISARARRRALAAGSCERNGLIGRDAGAGGWATGASSAASGGGAAGDAGAGKGGAGEAIGAVAAAGARAPAGAAGRIAGGTGNPAGPAREPPAGGVAGRDNPRLGVAGGAAAAGPPRIGAAGSEAGGDGGNTGRSTAGGAGGMGGGAGSAASGVGSITRSCSASASTRWMGSGRAVVTGAAAAGAAGAAGALVVGAVPSRRTAKTAEHTAQRARTPFSGTLPGSTRYRVLQLGQKTFIWASSPLVPCFRPWTEVGLRALPAIDHEYRSRQRLRVALHLGRQLADLSRMSEPAVTVGHDADRQRHQRHPVQLAPPVLAEEVAGPPILLVVLQRDQGVKHTQDLGAHPVNLGRRNDEDEVVTPDVAHEPPGPQHAFDHVVQDPGEKIDDAIAVVVAVAVVELLEVIEVGIADGELLMTLEPPTDFPLDLRRARQSGGRMDRHVALGPHQHRLLPRPVLSRREQSGDHLVRAGLEPGLNMIRMVSAGENGNWNDRGEGVGLELVNQREPAVACTVGVNEQQARVTPQDDRLDFIGAL